MSEWIPPLVILLRELRKTRRKVEEKKKEIEKKAEEVRERVEKAVPKPIRDRKGPMTIKNRRTLFVYYGSGEIFDLMIVTEDKNFSAVIRADDFFWSGTMDYFLEISPGDTLLKAFPVNNRYLLGVENVKFDHLFSVTIIPQGTVKIVEARILGIIHE